MPKTAPLVMSTSIHLRLTFQACLGWIHAPQRMAVISGKRISVQPETVATATIATTKQPASSMGSQRLLSDMRISVGKGSHPRRASKRIPCYLALYCDGT